MSIISTALTQGDVSMLSELGPMKDLYVKKIGKLNNLEVPASLADNHSELIKSLALMADGLGLISKTATDPISGLAGVKEYSEALQSGAKALEDTRVYILSRGISFQKEEPGNEIVATVSSASN